jgi:anaerobic ribonucleoside-triphosphate reductase
MKEVIHYIRQKIITRLNGNVSLGGNNVPVYNRVPSTQDEPYIIVYSNDESNIDDNQSSFITECVTRIEVVTSFLSDDGGELQANSIVNSILQLIRTSKTDYFDLSSNNFNVYTFNIEGISYIEDADEEKTYFRALIDISNRVQQI